MTPVTLRSVSRTRVNPEKIWDIVNAPISHYSWNSHLMNQAGC